MKDKNNELIVHIKPVCIEPRKYGLSALCISHAPYNFPGMGHYAANCICGIWKPVELVENEQVCLTAGRSFQTL